MKILSSQKGFTLIEILVSLAIFVVVAIISVGALLKILDLNRRSLILKTTINNLNFALESISREMRVGQSYYCSTNVENAIPNNYSSQSCEVSNGSWVIAFTASDTGKTCAEPNKIIYAYRYYNNTLEKAESECGGSVNSNSISAFHPIISSDVKITDSKAEVNLDSAQYQHAFIWFKGTTGLKEKDKEEFVIQTSVSARINTQ